MIWMKLFISDFERDTGHLSLAQQGALLALLRYYYARESPLPADLESLYRITKAVSRADQAAARSVVAEFFKVGDDGLLHNERADRQMPDDLAAIERAKVAGKKGGRPKGWRSGTQRENQEANQAGNLAHNQREKQSGNASASAIAKKPNVGRTWGRPDVDLGQDAGAK